MILPQVPPPLVRSSLAGFPGRPPPFPWEAFGLGNPRKSLTLLLRANKGLEWPSLRQCQWALGECDHLLESEPEDPSGDFCLECPHL